MKNDFVTILNRDEVTNDSALADTFMAQGIARVQRVCRLPNMERALLITPTDDVLVQFAVPRDLLQVIDVLVPREGSLTGQMRALKKVSYRKLMERDQNASPYEYARFQSQIYVRGAVPIGVQLQFLYYGNFSAWETPDSDNELSSSTPDLAIYAALKYAGDYFEHPLTASWENTFQTIKAETIQMAIDLENEGGVNEMEPIYFDED